jgi:hypothetical protein
MKRWFIAKLGDYEGDGSLISKVATYPNVNRRQWSKPGLTWCFGQLATNDITRFSSDADIYILPDGVMDMAVSAIPAGVRITMTTKLQAAGFTTSAIKVSWTIRQVLQYLKGQLQANTDVEAGDVVDIES